ncbi:MAG: hypothetical protein SOX72_08475 [Oscillospiraceae bacterium]|nr:hypothetical protein [Oscillospiraceae bacterium]MDY4192233.1 hypothetical protein [Oscillospiraceae bacterium]
MRAKIAQAIFYLIFGLLRSKMAVCFVPLFRWLLMASAPIPPVLAPNAARVGLCPDSRIFFQRQHLLLFYHLEESL